MTAVVKSTNNSATPLIRSRPRTLLPSIKNFKSKFRVRELYLQVQQQRDWRKQFVEAAENEIENSHCCRGQRGSRADSALFAEPAEKSALRSDSESHRPFSHTMSKGLRGSRFTLGSTREQRDFPGKSKVNGSGQVSDLGSHRSLIDAKLKVLRARRRALEFHRMCQRAANRRLPRMPSAYRLTFSPRKRPERHVLQSRMRVSDYKKNPCCLASPLPHPGQRKRGDLLNASNLDLTLTKPATVGNSFYGQHDEESWCSVWHCCGQVQAAEERCCIVHEGVQMEAGKRALAVRVQQQRYLRARKIRQPNAAAVASLDGPVGLAVSTSSPAVCQPKSEAAVMSAGATLTAATATAALAAPSTSTPQPLSSPTSRRTPSASRGFGDPRSGSGSGSRYSCRTPAPSDQDSLLLHGSDAVSMATQMALLPQLVRVSWMEEASVATSSASIYDDDASNWLS